ncbi:MAG: polysaccharide deacetylase family protein [Pseudomonadota bacterium]|nr:polysaccharide deacetylase family protein [Pseudomonadota bacterium]
MKEPKLLRMDDFGACSRVYEKHSSKFFGLLDFYPLYHRRLLGSWGPFRELSVEEIVEIATILGERNVMMLFCITAGWPCINGGIAKFHEVFPEQSKKIKEYAQLGIFQIANHGLTHCVLEDPRYRRPGIFGNRDRHREFLPERSNKHLQESIELSQQIISDYFEAEPQILVPPGHAISSRVFPYLYDSGIEAVASGSSHLPNIKFRNMQILNGENFEVFHTRDIVLRGTDFLAEVLKKGEFRRAGHST